MPLSLDAVTASLRAALPDTWESPGWRVGHIAPVRLSVEGNAALRRLRIGVDLYLIAEGDTLPVRLRGQLVSTSWAPLAALPPVLQSIPGETPDSPAVATGPLTYRLSRLGAPVRVSGERSWLQYLYPASALATSQEPASEPAPLVESLRLALCEWLTHDFPVATVGEAIETAMQGPVGHFGPLDSRVLERSGQSDLAVEATWLGEADNTAEQGGRPTLGLTLYGERFGTWLLHRCSMQAVKARPKQEPAPSPLYHHEVLMAETSSALMEQAGLGPVEKRLFQQAGLLPHARLWQGVESDASAEQGAEGSRQEDPPAGDTALDLSGVPDRPRRHLQAIATLAGQGKLGPVETDLLLKLARQLSRRGR